MNRYLILSIVLLFAAGAVFATSTAADTTQAGSNSGTTVIVKATKGLFVVRGGVLAKYDFATLKQVKELEMFGPPPTAPTDMTDTDARTKYFNDIQQRTAPALLIPRESDLLFGDRRSFRAHQPGDAGSRSDRGFDSHGEAG